MHRSNILLVLILVVAIMSTLSSCGKSDISDSHDIISNLLIRRRHPAFSVRSNTARLYPPGGGAFK